jgi:DNA-binding response OmpR family regulator
MVTGDPCGDILPTALAKGAADGLQKPLNFEILRIKLDRLAEAARRDSGSGGLSWGRALILHVEDDDEWANLVRNWLAGKNFNLHRVAGRIGLLDFLARCARLPDCIVLDLGLGEDDGLRICDELKANPRWQRIPILILTSRSGQRLAGFRHRAVALVAKMSKSAGEELVEALTSIIVQQEKAAGVFELGDLRLDPRGPHIYHNDKLLCSPAPREFAIMRLLIERSPHPVSEADIRAVSCKPREESRRNPFDPKPNTIQVYISNERRLLGDVVGSRIVHVPTQGYAYIPPSDNLAK